MTDITVDRTAASLPQYCLSSRDNRSEQQDRTVPSVIETRSQGEARGTGGSLFAPRRLLAALAIAAGVCGLLVAADFTRFVWALEERDGTFDPRADGIVALTGGAERIPDAVALLTAGRAQRLLITGVNQAASDSAIADGTAATAELLDCCIDVDRNALNTVGNALETARWVERNHFSSIIVVTSSYHMPRSLMELRRALPTTRLIAYPVVSAHLRLDRWWYDPGTLRLLVGEYAKYTGAMLHLRFDRPTATTAQAAL